MNIRRQCAHGRRRSVPINPVDALRMAEEFNTIAVSLVAETKTKAEHERSIADAHIEGLRKLARSQQARIAELERDKARLESIILRFSGCVCDACLNDEDAAIQSARESAQQREVKE